MPEFDGGAIIGTGRPAGRDSAFEIEAVLMNGRPDPYPEPEPETDGVREKLRDAIDPDRDKARPGGSPENPERLDTVRR